jgi:hypothetical protein
MPDAPTTPPEPAPKKVEIKEFKDIKEFKEKPEIKEKSEKFEKIEKIEKNEEIEIKEKPEKIEHKEKPEKWEHKEKPEKWEHKEKPEKWEHKEKIEIKEVQKVEQAEKLPLETGPKNIAETPPPVTPGGPVEQRLTVLEQTVTNLQHFITPQQRPDLSRGALSAELATKKPGG